MLDAALIKNWQVKGGQRVEFRIEAQNARNRPVFSDPATSYGASNFGVIKRYVGGTSAEGGTDQRPVVRFFNRIARAVAL